MENLFNNMSLLDEYLKYQRKSLPIAMIRALNRLYNPLSGKKVLSKKQYFFWTEKCVPTTSRDEELLKKYVGQWKKMVSNY